MEHTHDEHCGELLEALSAYLDGELEPDLCRQIEDHLAHCSPCVQFVKSLKGTIALSKGFQVKELPSTLPDSFKQELLAVYRKSLQRRSVSGQT